MRPAETRITILLLTAITLVVGATYFLVLQHEAHTVWNLSRGAAITGGAALAVLLGIMAMLADMRKHRRRSLEGARQWALSIGGTTPAPKDPDIQPFVTPLRERIEELSSRADSLNVQKKNLEIQLRLADAQRRQ